MGTSDDEKFYVTQDSPEIWAKIPYWLLAQAKAQSVVIYGALCWYAGMRDGARPSMSQLGKRIGVSTSTVERALTDLYECGAITITARDIATPKGRQRLPSHYQLHLKPVRNLKDGGLPASEGTPADDVRGYPADDVRVTPQMTEEVEERSKSRVSKNKADLDGFDDWWAEYPRKTNKTPALKAYEKAVREVGAPKLLEAIRKTEWPSEVKFTPHPATWLNQKRWTNLEESSGERFSWMNELRNEIGDEE